MDKAASLVNRLGPGGLLFLGPIIVALAIHYGAEACQADTCLDQGGSFNYETQPRSLTQSYPASPQLSRHRLNIVLASLAPSAEPILMWRPCCVEARRPDGYGRSAVKIPMAGLDPKPPEPVCRDTTVMDLFAASRVRNVLNTATQTAPTLCLRSRCEFHTRFAVAGYSIVRPFRSS